MTFHIGALTDGTFRSPFSRLRSLLGEKRPGRHPVIDLSLGEPRETLPRSVADVLGADPALLAKYPAIRGSDQLRGAIADWHGRRYRLSHPLDPAQHILPCNGSREGLFYAGIAAVSRRAETPGRPAILMCNPYYQSYLGAALATGAEPVFLSATAATGFLPDLSEIRSDAGLLARTVALYLCSPSNPEGAVASAAYLEEALALARAWNFLLLLDECYSEIYHDEPPPGGLEVASRTGDGFANILTFNSLSKRSNLPGLRSGFMAGDAGALAKLSELRNLIGPQMPGPVQAASAAAWSDEAHVETNRQAYRVKFDRCDAVLTGHLGYRRPKGGFFLWLDVTALGGCEAAAVTLWQHCGVKVVPGAYLAQAGRDGTNPGANAVRIALVDHPDLIQEALDRIVGVLA